MDITSPSEDDYYPILFGIEGEERQEFNRMAYPDDAFHSLVLGQADIWRTQFKQTRSTSVCRREMLTVCIKQFGRTVHLQGGFSMDLVLCLSFHLLDKIEHAVEVGVTPAINAV